MPLEQTEPFHHSDRGERPHALLSNDELGDRIVAVSEAPVDDAEADASMILLNELIREYYIRQQENKVEPTEGFEEFQAVDRDFQDFHMSDDVFEQAWGITKMALVRDSIESEDEDDFYRNSWYVHRIHHMSDYFEFWSIFFVNLYLHLLEGF